MKIAIIYASKKGQTAKIARFMQTELQRMGIEAVIFEPGWFRALEGEFDRFIVGAPVYVGRFPMRIRRWVKSHKQDLEKKPSAFFSVTLNAADKRPTARKDDDRLLREFMDKTEWYPPYCASIAGALMYQSYSWLVRRSMKKIAAEAGGSLDISRNHEYTDWPKVTAFLQDFIALNKNSVFATEKRLERRSA